MKGTRHNGRSREKMEFIIHFTMIEDLIQNTVSISNNERVRQNIYWDCYQGYTTMEDQRKEDNFSFEQIELAFYEEHYGNYVMKQK